jgi:hypothetical protein
MKSIKIVAAIGCTMGLLTGFVGAIESGPGSRLAVRQLPQKPRIAGINAALQPIERANPAPNAIRIRKI